MPTAWRDSSLWSLSEAGRISLAAWEAALWLDKENLTVEYWEQVLSRYEVALHSQTGKLIEVGNSQPFETAYLSPQLRLFDLTDLRGVPALWAGEYTPREPSRPKELQEALFPEAKAN